MTIISTLRDSLETGFIERDYNSTFDYQPQLIINRKSENKKILGTILYELRRCKSFCFSVAFLTTSGVAVLFNTLEDLELKGIKGKVLVSQYQNFTQPEALKKLMAFKNIDLKIVTRGDFHAKGYIFEHPEYFSLIIGSSNLTSGALTSNKEWNLRVSGMPDSKIIHETIKEFEAEFEYATDVTEKFIEDYRKVYEAQKVFSLARAKEFERLTGNKVQPNEMQKSALSNLKALRESGKEKALLISATGTGKTYLSAFDVKLVNPTKILFIVHRANIANKAMESFKKIMPEKSMGMFSGNRKETDKDYLFSTVQTVSRDENLYAFHPEQFDYVIIDETHRAGAETYQKILKHLKPKFLLGMTATPERTDGFDIFKQFDYNIAYEIRLHQALEEEMLCPFHYYGITDVEVDEKEIEGEQAFLKLTSEERVNHIIERSLAYGCDDGYLRGLIFCNSNKVSYELSNAFNKKGFKTVALSGESSEEERELAIERLESDDLAFKLDYIFTVDIFNEGIDIPRVNQIIMLRPTQSSIVFIQQMGRGLRKTLGKRYLTIIDFIGNYTNNFLVPIALYGDSTYNKDHLRKIMNGESNAVPGSSTVNFQQVAKERIYAAIDNSQMDKKKDLIRDYELLKYKIGKIPMMMDFVEHGSRDPYLYVESAARSYYNFVQERESLYKDALDQKERKLFECISKELANGKRIEEVVLLQMIISEFMQNGTGITVASYIGQINKLYGYTLSKSTIESTIHNLNLRFVTENSEKVIENEKVFKINVGEKYGFDVVEISEKIIKEETVLSIGPSLIDALNNETFIKFLNDILEYAKVTYDSSYTEKAFIDGFILYKKYSRKDVFRILNWRENPVAQNVGGYIVSPDKTNCPIFVNYHKAEDISATTKYEDEFTNSSHLTWYSKSKRTINSPDVNAIIHHKENEMRIPLFVKKNNDEGLDFYYMGDLNLIENTVSQELMPAENGKSVSVVKMQFQLSVPVEHDLFSYITSEGSIVKNI